MTKHQKAALVLSGGAALGAAHIGVLQVLEEDGWMFDYFAGVSAGSIIASLAACGHRSGWIKKKLDDINFFSLAFDFRNTLYALLRGDKAKAILDELFGDRRIEDLDSRLIIGATDFSTGARVLLEKGKIADAVRASISVPLLFEPFYHAEEGRWLADGGLSQNYPLDHAISQYAGERIFGVDVATCIAQDVQFDQKGVFGKTKNLLATAERTARIMLKNQQTLFAADERVIEIRPVLARYTAADVFRLDAISAAGAEAARGALGERSALLCSALSGNQNDEN